MTSNPMMQAILNSVVYAAEIAVIALGVSLTFSLLRFANFAHIQLAVVGAYLACVARRCARPAGAGCRAPQLAARWTAGDVIDGLVSSAPARRDGRDAA